jgi:hypothetical protein
MIGLQSAFAIGNGLVVATIVGGVIPMLEPLFQITTGDDKSRDRLNKDATMTGCLNKDASGNYTLTDENTGVKTTVIGPDLEKHSSNHKVTLTGTTKADTSGKSVFEVSKIQHVSTSCKAPPQ